MWSNPHVPFPYTLFSREDCYAKQSFLFYLSYGIIKLGVLYMDKFNETINHIKEKVGEENSALISDELISLMTEHKALTEQNTEQTEQINTLKSEKDDLVNANAKLFRRLGFEDEQQTTFVQNTTVQQPEVKEIELGDIINEKGDII